MRGAPLLTAAVALAALAGVAAAAPLPTRVTPDHVRLGEPFVEEITVAHAPGATVALRPPPALGDFSLLGVERLERAGATVLRARLALYRLGAHALPPLAIDVGGQPAVSAPETVTGVPTLPPGGNPTLAGVHAPVALTRLSWRVVAALVLAVLALAAAALLLVRRLMRRRTLEARTRRALDALAAELAAGVGLYPWWSTLAAVLRGYVGARAGIDAMESTTAELGARLAARPMPGLDEPQLIAWLEQADLVKFARDASDVEGARSALAFARRMVEATTAEVKKGDDGARLAVS